MYKGVIEIDEEGNEVQVADKEISLGGLVEALADFSANNTIYWSEKMALRKNLPKVFKGKFSKCLAIIDCPEIFIDRPFDNVMLKMTTSLEKG